MRTRFLPIDFFHLTSNQALETENVDIFRLPVPQIDPPNLQFEFNFDDLDFVDGVSCELELLPIGKALSHFLSDSLPCVIDCENGEFPVIWRGVGDEDESNANGQVFRSGRKEFEISQKESGVLHGDTKAKKQSNLSYKNPEKEVQNCSGLVVEFEVPEVWENAKPCEKEEIICFGFPEVEIPLDDVKTKFGDTIPYSSQVLKSIYSVEDITTEFNMAQATYYVDPSSVQESTVVYTCKILNFEIPKVGFELYACSSIKEELQLLLSNLPPCCWAKNDELKLNFKENFQMKDVNILECLSNQGAADKFLELQPTCLDSLLEMDPISDGQCFSILSKFHLDEVQILDFDYFQPIENYASGLELEALEQMCGESINSIGCFYDNIVDTELALMDDTFVSFPIPVFCDRNDMMHLPSTLNGIIAGLKPHFETACDEIYLDWRLLREDTSSSVVSSAYKDILKEVDTYDSYESSPEPQSTYWKMVFDLIFCDATPDDLTTLKPKDEINKLHGAISAYSEPLLEIKPSQLIEKQKSGNGEPVLTAKSNNGSFISESMSQFNDLSFFLDPLNGTTGGKLEEIIQMSDNLVAAPVGSSTNPIVVSPQKTSRLWDVEVHQVKLSHHILSLIDSIQKCYFSIVENDTDLGKKYSSPEGEFQLLRLPKQKLWDLITNVSSDEAETFIAYVSLYVIKQMVHYLCFFGIHTAHLYLSSLSQKLKYLRVKLRLLHPLIEDAKWKAEKGLIESHPSLSIVGEVLKSNTCKSAKRMLIVADRVYWWPLKRKLTSLSISFNEVGKCPTRLNQVHSLGSEEFSNAMMESGCLLTSHDHISSSFPFHKFSVILEYGGSCGSSNISTIRLNLAGLPYVYFFKVQLEDCSVPRAFCEGFDVGQYPNFKMGGVSQQMPIIQESVNRQQLLELLNFVPVSENDYTGTAEASHQPTSVSSIPFPLDSIERMKSTTHSSPNTVIIVNTLSFDKEMLMFRRSSYEKILAMEKSGIQVVEREFNLPVDLIFGSGICLIWYNASGFAAIAKDYSSIPEYMENIAVNILMSLSFAFRECILVFEGENVFLDGVKEWSDGLYAAAATLDMRLQPFFSYSPELTDEIIMSCVNDATKLNRGLYPPMSDSETLGESFLTAFPSINPLSAHAILSSGGMLVDFLGWSHEQCVQAIQKFSIPLESISLFSILCKYGEIVESKSGTTECSSSVSSALDSDYSCNKMQSKRKKKKFADGSWYLEPLDRTKDGNPNGMFSNNPELAKNSDGKRFSMNDQWMNSKHDLDDFVTDKLDWNDLNLSKSLGEDFMGEVIDHKISLLNDDFSCRGNMRPAKRRLAFDAHNPIYAEIDCQSDIWISSKDDNKLFEEKTNPDIVTDMESLPNKLYAEFSEDGGMQKSAGNTLGMPFHDKLRPSSGEKLFSNAIHSAQLQERSPWTLEFLKGIKEKTRKHKQSLHSLSCNTTSDCSGSFRNTEKIIKRQSPSALDAYKYFGGSQHLKTIPQKWQKRLRRSLDARDNEKTDLSSVPTWTPLDKRARKILSFSRSGNERQSKLVWADGNIHS